MIKLEWNWFVKDNALIIVQKYVWISELISLKKSNYFSFNTIHFFNLKKYYLFDYLYRSHQKILKKNHIKHFEPKISYIPRSLTSSEIINSVTSNGDSIVPITIASFQKNKMIPYQEVLSSSRARERSEMVFSTGKNSTTITNNDKYKQLKNADQYERW